MPWLRVGDNMATHPFIGALLASANFDHQVKNECIGVLTQLAATSGAHLTDGVINTGSLAQVAPGREREILNHFVEAGIAKEIFEDEKLIGAELVLDDEEFFHIKMKYEVEQDRARKRDYRKPGLWAQVRMRDGDACRWCGKSVSWTNRTGYRQATIDSLNGHKDSTVDTLVVACGPCNSARGGGAEMELLAAPENPIYGKHTVQFVNNDAWCKDNGIEIHVTNSTTPLELELIKTADTPRSGGEPAHSEVTGASDVRSNSVEVPEWVEASSEQMEKLWSKTADTLRSGDKPAHSKATGASDDHSSSPANHHAEEVADTPRSGHAQAHSKATGASDDEIDSDIGHIPRPRSDLGHKGDAAGIVGSGRVGSGRQGTARHGDGSAKRSRKVRRGRKRG